MTTKPPTEDGSGLNWFKSSYSSADGPSCVEVAATSRTIHVRDTKDIHLPHLDFNPTAWDDFITHTSKG